MHDNNFWLEEHIYGFHVNKTVKPGFILQLPTNIYRQDLQDKINNEIIQYFSALSHENIERFDIQPNASIPQVRIRLAYAPPHPRNSNSTETQCLAIECAPRDRRFIDHVMSELSRSNVDKFGLYMPYIVTHSATHLSLYKKMMQAHCKTLHVYTNTHTTITSAPHESPVTQTTTAPLEDIASHTIQQLNSRIADLETQMKSLEAHNQQLTNDINDLNNTYSTLTELFKQFVVQNSTELSELQRTYTTQIDELKQIIISKFIPNTQPSTSIQYHHAPTDTNNVHTSPHPVTPPPAPNKCITQLPLPPSTLLMAH